MQVAVWHHDRVIAEARTDPERVPRLARDSWRVWLATGLALPLAMVGAIAYAVVEVRADRPLDQTALRVTALLLDYIVLFVLYQILTWRMFARLASERLIHWIASTTPRTTRARRIQAWLGFGPKAWSVSAAALGLIAALVIALNDDLRRQPAVVTMSLLSVASAYTMIIFAYAVQYLRQNVDHPGLVFPGRPELVWRDYFYLAVQVSTTFSTSDVEVTTTEMRGTVTAQSIVAFVFNTVIVALLVSALLTFA